MKKTLTVLSILGVFLLVPSMVLAAPFNADNNPQIVANYASGDHGIPGESETHNGKDVVMVAGTGTEEPTRQTHVVQQWFYGTSTENGGITEGDHSVWMLSKDGACPDSFFTMTVGHNNFWGDYLVEGGTYCIHTNDFHVSK